MLFIFLARVDGTKARFHLIDTSAVFLSIVPPAEKMIGLNATRVIDLLVDFALMAPQDVLAGGECI